MAAALLVATTVVIQGVASGPAYAEDEQPRAGWSPNKQVLAIASEGDRVYIGGSFTRLTNTATGETVARSHVAALDATTGELVRDWAPAIDDDVRALAVAPGGGVVYAGGSFTTVAGAGARKIAAIQRDGQLVPGWDASASDAVRALVLHDGGLYLGGSFNSVNGLSRIGVARVDAATGALADSWAANIDATNARVLSLTKSSGGDLVVAGNFHTLDGKPRDYLGAVAFGSGEVTGWQPPEVCGGCYLWDVASQGGSVYAAVAGLSGGRLVAYSESTGAPRWKLQADGNVQAVDVHDGIVYAGGHFGPTFAGAPRNQLAAVYADDGRLTDFAPRMGAQYHPGVWDIHADTQVLRVGGGFDAVGSTQQQKYAVFDYPDTTAHLRLVPSITGAGTVQAVEGGSYECARTGNQDDRVTAGCDPGSYEAPQQVSVWLRAVPAASPAGQWAFRGWAGCDETRPGPDGTECGLTSRAADDDVERTPTATFADDVAPEVQLAPSTQTTSDTATFAFSASDGRLTCRLSGPGRASGFVRCGSPASYSDLADGDHTFTVRATDRSGNVGETSHRWSVDRRAPQTYITSSPPKSSFILRARARVGYTSSEAGSSYQCLLNGVARQCGGSSVLFTAMAQRTHRFEVRATDTAGHQDATSAYRTWTVPHNNARMRQGRRWTQHSGAGYYLGSYSQTRLRGATISAKVTGARKLALVATKAPGHGKVEIYLDSRHLKTVRLAADSLRKRTLIPITTFARGRTGRVRVVVVSAKRTVRIEGLGIATRLADR